jgi:hypothetical protein
MAHRLRRGLPGRCTRNVRLRDLEHVTEVLAAAGWAPPRFEELDVDLDIAAGRGLEEAVVPAQPAGTGRLRGAMWLISRRAGLSEHSSKQFFCRA